MESQKKNEGDESLGDWEQEWDFLDALKVKPPLSFFHVDTK